MTIFNLLVVYKRTKFYIVYSTTKDRYDIQNEPCF